MKPKISLKVTSGIICLIYLLSICATLPYAFMLEVISYCGIKYYLTNYDTYVKSSRYTNRIVFLSAILFVTTLLPTAIMTAIYYSASVALAKRSTTMQCSLQWKKRTVINRKVNRMFIVAVVCYFITVAPYTTECVFTSFVIKYNWNMYKANYLAFVWVQFVFQTIMTFNCFINPFVYCKMRKDVVLSIKKMLSAIKTNRPREM